MRANCNKIKSEANHSIDEQIIPAKTKKSDGVRQHNPKKPHKWGFKNLVRAGIIYDFFLRRGKNSTGGNSFSAGAIVLKLSDRIPRNQGFRIFFDNWFSTLDLMVQLKAMGTLIWKGIQLLHTRSWKTKVADLTIIGLTLIQGFKW